MMNPNFVCVLKLEILISSFQMIFHVLSLVLFQLSGTHDESSKMRESLIAFGISPVVEAIPLNSSFS